jgi:hypothetical protein
MFLANQNHFRTNKPISQTIKSMLEEDRSHLTQTRMTYGRVRTKGHDLRRVYGNNNQEYHLFVDI